MFCGSTQSPYRIAPLFCRPWTLNGIPPRLIESHYEHHYGAAINRLNAITGELALLDPAGDLARCHQPAQARPIRRTEFDAFA